MNPILQAHVSFVGTAHDYRDLSKVTTMYRDIVPDFLRKFENDLMRTDTLLIVEGNSSTLTGKGDTFHGYKSRNYLKKLGDVFGSDLPYWIKSFICVADRRDSGFQFKLNHLSERISETGAIVPNELFLEEIKRPIITKAKILEVAKMKDEPLDDTSKYGTIDWKCIAEKVFYNLRSYVDRTEVEICQEFSKGCDEHLIYAVTKWQGWFRKIIVVTGAMHSEKVCAELGMEYHDMIPELVESRLHELFPNPEQAAALGLICQKGFYEKVREHCTN